MSLTAPQKFKRGDVREDGYTFHGYKPDGKPQWYCPASTHRQRMGAALRSARREAKRRHLPFDLTVEHLLRIYPADNICPVLGIKMIPEGPRSDYSPSLDKRIPALGYTIGNVAWISNRANRIKSDATADELTRIADYTKRQVN